MSGVPGDITPETRVGELLDRFPALEETLIGLSPEFQRLRNPVLRRTVAKVATLRQISKVGGVPLGTLINTLREKAGLAPAQTAAGGAGGAEPAPDWFDPAKVNASFDARPALSAGQHPMPEIMAKLLSLPAGGIFALQTPFTPAPLMDLAKGKGFECWSRTETPELTRTYFHK
ncbi:MAG: hypothetical protein A2X36_08475 [Elusimicrobia bacterium GWA2_69_24]|nr:MAG: hypothetical protein A2X36_08475 [Elusimicrobia bacterium GWA2_69_24]HBL16953.1 hypothetical protein [Elusimicrobiota bacterium]